MEITENSLFEVDLFGGEDSEVLSIHELRGILNQAYQTEPGYVEWNEEEAKEYAQFIKEFKNCHAEEVLNYAKDYGYVLKSIPGEVEKRNKRVEELKKIAPFAYDKNGKLLNLQEQKENQFNNAIKWGLPKTPYVVFEFTDKLNIDLLQNKPIILTHENIKHIYNKHIQDSSYDLGLDESLNLLGELREEIEGNYLAYQDDLRPNHICFVLPKVSEHNNQLIAVVDIDTTMGQLEVNKITSVHGLKELLKKIQLSIDKNLGIYTNNKTKGWIDNLAFDFKGDLNTPAGRTISTLIELYYKQNNIRSQEENPSVDIGCGRERVETDKPTAATKNNPVKDKNIDVDGHKR